MVKYFALLFTVFLLSCANENAQEQADAEIEIPLAQQVAYKVADAYGIDNWNKIDQLNFTFNVSREKPVVERSYKWWPKKGLVQYSDVDTTVEFKHPLVDTSYKAFDAKFVNDKYWLLTPFQLKWDKNLQYSYEKESVNPIDSTACQKLTIQYPNDGGGYTPGDAYDFFIDSSYLIKAWNFRKAGQKEVNMTTSWEIEKSFRGVKMASVHKSIDETFKLYFTDLSIKTD